MILNAFLTNPDVKPVFICPVQAGLEPTDWKAMTSVGGGVREIRIRVGGACVPGDLFGVKA
jgi:hypothetical protein